MKKLTKKGQVMQNLGGLAVGIAVLAISLTVTFLILSKGEDSISSSAKCGNTSWVYNSSTKTCCFSDVYCTGENTSTGFSSALNGTRTLASATDDIPSWAPLIVIVGVGAVLLALVNMFRNR